MTHRRLTIAAATILLTAGVLFPPASAKMTPGTEPDLPELNRLQNVDRRVTVDFENVPAIKVLEAIAVAGGFHLYAEGPEDGCYVTVSLNSVPVRRALEIVAGQAGLRYKVVGADSLRVMLPSPVMLTDDIKTPELVTKIDPIYPSDARDAGVDGTAVPGWPSLDRNAVEALREWKYRPAMKDGYPVSVYATVVIQFRLAEAE
jgi:hypothetical protein